MHGTEFNDARFLRTLGLGELAKELQEFWLNGRAPPGGRCTT